jgi:hypothetical protein
MQWIRTLPVVGLRMRADWRPAESSAGVGSQNGCNIASQHERLLIRHGPCCTDWRLRSMVMDHMAVVA